MKHTAAFAYAALLILLGAAVYIFAPALRHRVEVQETPATTTSATVSANSTPDPINPAITPIGVKPSPKPTKPAPTITNKPQQIENEEHQQEHPAGGPLPPPPSLPHRMPYQPTEPRLDVEANVAPLPPIAIQDAPKKRSVNRTYLLNPNEKKRIRNSSFPTFHIRASSPISVAFGDCSNDYTFDFQCSTYPSDILLHDLGQSQSTMPNRITINGTID